MAGVLNPPEISGIFKPLAWEKPVCHRWLIAGFNFFDNNPGQVAYTFALDFNHRFADFCNELGFLFR